MRRGGRRGEKKKMEKKNKTTHTTNGMSAGTHTHTQETEAQKRVRNQSIGIALRVWSVVYLHFKMDDTQAA